MFLHVISDAIPTFDNVCNWQHGATCFLFPLFRFRTLSFTYVESTKSNLHYEIFFKDGSLPAVNSVYKNIQIAYPMKMKMMKTKYTCHTAEGVAHCSKKKVFNCIEYIQGSRIKIWRFIRLHLSIDISTSCQACDVNRSSVQRWRGGAL